MRGAFAGVRFTPFSRLVDFLGAPGADAGGVGRRPLPAAVLGAGLRVALSRCAGALAPVADHPATEESLARAYRLLRPLDRDDLDRVASMSSRAADVVRLVRTARSAIEGGWYDREELTSLAALRCESGEADLEEAGPIVFHLPDPMSTSELNLLGVLARRSDVTVLVSCLGDPVADRSSTRLISALGEAGLELVAPSRRGAPDERKAGFERVIGAPDLEEEVRTALRLLAARAETGDALGRTAIVVPPAQAGQAYLSVIEELFDSAGMPWTGPPSTTAGDTPAGKLVTGLIALLLEREPELERSAVISWMSSPALSARSAFARGLAYLTETGADALPIGAFDRCSRAAGVVSGLLEWRRRLGSYERRAESRAVEGAPSQAAGDLLRLVNQLSRLAEELSALSRWDEVAQFFVKAAELVLEPGEELDRLTDLMVDVAELEGLEPLARRTAAPSGGIGTFERQVTSALSASLGRPGPSRGRFGVGPVVGSAAALAGIRCDLLILLGATEGVLPGRTPEDPLVTDLERQATRALSEMERTEERDRRATMMLLAGAERSIATYPRVSMGSSRLAYPSRWLTGDLFNGEFEEIPSFSGALSLVASGAYAPADPSDLEMAIVQSRLMSPRRLEDTVVASLDDLPRRLSAEAERSRPGLNRFGGLIGPGRASGEVFAKEMSATRMEHMAKCPLSFMFQRVVRVEVLKSPERRHSIEPMDRGSLMHDVLEEFVQETAIAQESFDGWDGESIAVLRQIAEKHFLEYEERGLTGKPVYWGLAKSRILSDLVRFVEIESDRLRSADARPFRTELAFGTGKEAGPVEIRAGSHTMTFTGRVDRIDLEPDGVVRVVDYKSGKLSHYAAIEKDALDGGRHLQLPIYAKAVAPLIENEADGRPVVIAEYRFCCAEAGFKRVPVELTRELDTALSDALGVLGDTIEAGAFPPRPGSGDERAPANCRYCDYSQICRLDRTSLWRRASEDASMARYVELVSGQKG